MTESHRAPTPTDPSAIDWHSLRTAVIIAEYDCPGDMPEQVGWQCLTCKATWQAEEDGDVAHETNCSFAAVEALRERVTAQENEMDSLLECWAHIHVQLEKFTGRKFDETELPRTVGGVLEAFENMEVRAEAAEARVLELAGALAFYRADDERAVMGGVLESAFDRPATATLAAQPRRD